MPFVRFAGPHPAFSGNCQRRSRPSCGPNSRPAFPFNNFFDIITALDSEVAKKTPTEDKKAISPRFDVVETDDAYILEGELPGVTDKKSIDIEFSDPQTLVVKGEITRPSYTNKQEEQLPSYEETPAQPVAEKADTASVHSKTPTVEDTQDESDSDKDDFEVVDSPFSKAKAAETSTSATSTPTLDNDLVAEKPQEQPEAPTPKPQPQVKAKFWLSERVIGTYERAFQFQTLIDQDAVKAQLENGLLQIVVPKREAVVRQVRIQ